MIEKRFGNNDHEALKKRSDRCICKHCGGKLTTSLVIYDIYGGAGEELYCPHCEKKELGTEPELYALASYYVENFQFNYFYDMEENEVNEQLNIAKVVDLMAWLLKKIGLLDQDGLNESSADYGRIFERNKV